MGDDNTEPLMLQDALTTMHNAQVIDRGAITWAKR